MRHEFAPSVGVPELRHTLLQNPTDADEDGSILACAGSRVATAALRALMEDENMPIDVSTAISALALAVSLAAAVIGGLSVRTARAALRASQERFTKEGPMLDIRTMYTYGAPPHEMDLIGIDAEIRNAGRTSTTITSVGLHDAERGYDNVVEDQLGVGATRRYDFDVDEFADWLGEDLSQLRFTVETGHGEWYGDCISPEVENDLRAALQKARHSKMQGSPE